ncbi:helix-turn-helix domain-containing protein [Antarcticirhabdus aurantiaca]|uniref:Helix-turn-helix domain-containing protein n=1 Tax=Antarcticirhabdus aurantiaca TaxID=2606717 RepID=A0ACD4NNT7_9HYPH|nr:helix-turn-helix domain-containing protein [Antarcticirhabdus aurantiaca]WAJ28408.1 helix-turn-helix domain-containing protein [Jeongeuplla avenae]
MSRHPIDLRLGGRLRELRERRGLSIATACRRLGVDRGQFRRYEAAEDRICPATLLDLSRILKVDVLDFFEAASCDGVPPSGRDAADGT